MSDDETGSSTDFPPGMIQSDSDDSTDRMDTDYSGSEDTSWYTCDSDETTPNLSWLTAAMAVAVAMPGPGKFHKRLNVGRSLTFGTVYRWHYDRNAYDKPPDHDRTPLRWPRRSTIRGRKWGKAASSPRVRGYKSTPGGKHPPEL